MPTNEFINKVILDDQVKLDLTGDTVTENTLAKGVTAHDKSGAPITGKNENDVNSQDATAAAAEILKDKTAYARGTKISGTMPNNGAVSRGIERAEEEFTIPMGFHDGSGKVGITETERAKLIPGNIKKGVELLGIIGSMEPSSSVSAHAKSVTPKFQPQTVLPDEGYDYLSQVTVAAIPYSETDNAAGGVTLTIGA